MGPIQPTVYKCHWGNDAREVNSGGSFDCSQNGMIRCADTNGERCNPVKLSQHWNSIHDPELPPEKPESHLQVSEDPGFVCVHDITV